MGADRGSRVDRNLLQSLEAAAEIVESRERTRARLLGRERNVAFVLAGSFVVAALLAAVAIPSEISFSLPLALLLVSLYAVVSRVEFEIGPGSAVPTTLVLVPMLFLLPAGAVPLCVAAGLIAGGVVDRLRSQRHTQRLAVPLSSAWPSIGPAVVVGTIASGPPRREDIPVYALALLAQFALYVAVVVLRHRVGRGTPVRDLVPPLAWVMLVDLALAPVALLVAGAAAEDELVVLCVLPLAALLHMLGTDRKRRIEESVLLGIAVEDAAREARSDPLTGVGNRLAWQEAVERAERRHANSGIGSTVVVVDLDRLKETNDKHGHDVGDRLIKALATALAEAVPDADVLTRIGGDEFAILSAGGGQLGCAELLFRVRTALADVAVGEVVVSASVGAAACPPCASVTDAIRLADERLYAEKPAGHGDPYRSLQGPT
jgi:diguanylate cyclase (GGDEF)-like protein